MGFGDVVKGHHHQSQEEHRGHGANPVPVRREQAVLVRRSGPAHQLERSHVGGKKADPGNPRRHLATRQEEVRAGVGLVLEQKTHAKDSSEVDDDDKDVEPVEVRGRHQHQKQARRRERLFSQQTFGDGRHRTQDHLVLYRA